MAPRHHPLLRQFIIGNPYNPQDQFPKPNSPLPVEKSLGNLNIPPKCYLTLSRQAGELECFQPWISNFEITVSTPTIPLLKFQLEGGIVTLPVPSNLWGFGYSSLSNWHSSLLYQCYSKRTLKQYQYLGKIQSRHQTQCLLWTPTCLSVFELVPWHEIKPYSALKSWFCSYHSSLQFNSCSTHLRHLVMALISDFFVNTSNFFFIKLKNYIKVSSSISLRPSTGPHPGFSPLLLGPWDFSIASKVSRTGFLIRLKSKRVKISQEKTLWIDIK